MSAINRRQAIGRFAYWVSIAVGVTALKQFYSTASADQLQWMLRPLVLLLELLSDLSLEPTPSHAWLDASHRISIVKSCAGVNFFIISLLGYLWQRRNNPCRLHLFFRALASAWLTALAANTLRILISVYGEDWLVLCFGLTETECHRLIGIAVYFLCLWLQLACYRQQGFSRSAITALTWYLSIVLLIPLVRGWLFNLEPLSWRYAAWVVSVPFGTVLLGYCFNKK